jgi:2-amino-4-hydroxy-6-hydroxymethyldihydropteridine diphosphokinase
MLWFEKALNLIATKFGSIIGSSSVYETAAWGNKDQPDFLNMVLIANTQLAPLVAINTLLGIEAELGRKREMKWGQRTIDIDILFFGNKIIQLPQLVIPHPFITQRRFVLMPLAEIAPDFLHPVLKKSMAELLQECPDESQVKLVPKAFSTT